MSSVHRRLVLVAAVTIAVDLAVKAAAVRWLTDPVDLGVIILRTTENSGVAFGIGADQPFAVVAALTGLVVAAIAVAAWRGDFGRSEEHTSELQSLMRISYAVFCLKKKKIT